MALHYFIPDWDDRVDPGYNFLTDEHTPGRVPYRDDRYAHELYDEPPYDGILLSRATLDDNPAKRAAIHSAGTVHRYLRLPVDGEHLVLGDCGAFSYWQQDEPPYQTAEVLDYYQDLGFDLGVSIDHLIFPEVAHQRNERWDITMHNAEEFLQLHRSGRYRFTPVGVAQGWSPDSYKRAAAGLIQMGYRYIAIGGLARSQTRDVIPTLAAVHEVLPVGMHVHLFGVNRPEFAREFARLGVTSFDSASRLRRAWMDGKRNYFIGDKDYTAIRIPATPDQLEKLRRALKKVRENYEPHVPETSLWDTWSRLIRSTGGDPPGEHERRASDNEGQVERIERSLDGVQQPPLVLSQLWERLRKLPTKQDERDILAALSLLKYVADHIEVLVTCHHYLEPAEHRALDQLRAYARDELSLEDAHAAVAEYALLSGDHRQRVEGDYWRTLEAKPWERCPCAICQALGVEVIIFRGNNRNRRRGFHNTWQLYYQLQRESSPPARAKALVTQLELAWIIHEHLEGPATDQV
ncbi:MAG TPA: tRNA-guanine transglycosylase DpdA [Herpetosiphonaceae bacterium]|nr:tRNA-guanine transglycosylase DpdA [Herpetosiphonaceae bacterium]